MTREKASSVSLAAPAARFCVVTLLSAPLWLAIACISDPGDGDEVMNAQVQEALVSQAGAGCTVLRPVGWVVAGVACVETPTTSIFIVDGDTYTATSLGGNFGSGST